MMKIKKKNWLNNIPRSRLYTNFNNADRRNTKLYILSPLKEYKRKDQNIM